MLISLNEVKKLVAIPAGVTDEELITTIGSRLVEIEEVIDLAPKYKGITIVKVVSCEDIPDTHLHLCQVDDGSAETTQVVCGAPNVHAGMLAVWLRPGCVVPETYGNENFRLGTRKLQGYESNGMLAAIDELDLGTDHEGIAEIDPKTAKPGDDFAEIFELNDIIIDVENKSLTHRPDCFGIIGFAREVAGILGVSFVEPELMTAASLAAASALAPNHSVPLSVEIADPLACPRYSGAVFDLPKHEKNKYLDADAIFLAKAGMRAIDPIVDVTNLIMLRTGQPLHAFDYDKFVKVGGTDSPKIIVRRAAEGEELQLLDGKTIKCVPTDVLITSNNVPVALGGAMGGYNTEIDASTKRVVLESATFAIPNMRKAQMEHGIFSEAITRFTKGQPAPQTLPVLYAVMRELGVTPLAVADAWPAGLQKNVVKITTSSANQLLGTTYSAKEMVSTLENVGFKVSESGDELTVTAPDWRTDIHISEDVIEEIGRLLGFDNIPLDLPKKPFSGTSISAMWMLKQELRNLLSGTLQMHELLTYSFISRDLLERAGQDPEDAYKIVNSISPELQHFRTAIVPSLLDKVRENQKSGHDDFALYELNQISAKSFGLTDEQTPVLEQHLGIVALADFYTLKSDLIKLLGRGLRVQFEYSAMTANSKIAEMCPYLEPARSAAIFINGEPVGAFGEIKSSVLRRFKIDHVSSACELNLEKVVNAPRNLMRSLNFSKFPFVERDLTLRVASDAEVGRFCTALENTLQGKGLIATVTPTSVFQTSADAPVKNISFHLKFASSDKTLTQPEISGIMDEVTVATTTLGAEVI